MVQFACDDRLSLRRQVMIISASDQPTEFFPEAIDIILFLTALISTFISLLIPCLYYLKRECQQHPTVLIANISLLQSVANFNIVLMAINIFTFENVVDIKRIFHLLTLDLIHLASTDENTDFCVYNYWMYMLVELLSISFHICYSVDLFLTIKFPFLTGKKRRKFYYAFSAILPALTLAASSGEALDICSHELVTESIYKVPFWFLVTLIVFCVISVVIVLISFFQRRSEAKIRRNYIRQHRIVLSLLVLLWIAPIWSNILLRMDLHATLLFDVVNKAAFFCIVSTTGVITIARMAFDKFLRQRVKQMLCMRVSEKREVQSEDEESTSGSVWQQEKIQEQIWNLPLSGAMNELHSQQIVHNIIQVVCEACSAHAIKNSHLRESHVHDESVSSSVSHSTIVIEQEFQSEDSSLSRLFLRRQEIKYQHKDPHDCTVEELKELCRKKRKFQMVCLNAYHGENDMLGTKTVHMWNKVAREEEEVSQMLNIKVTSYSHRIFETLRNYDNLTPEKVIETLDLQRNIESIKQAKESLGASGSFFFFSYDHRIVIKTISQEQKDRFLSLLPYYFDHIRYNQHSLLARTYGIFSVEIAGVSKIYFLMMENTFCQLQRAGVSYTVYDLKGSTVQREVKDPEAKVKKDIDYFRSPDCFLFLSKESRTRLIDQLQKDIGMLRKHNIMDYSLLLGVGKSPSAVRKRELYARGIRNRRQQSFRCVEELQEITRRVYSLSLIDYLQEFNFNKKMELWLKRIFKGGGDISSIGTEEYYKRFMNFIRRIVVAYDVKFQKQRIHRTM